MGLDIYTSKHYAMTINNFFIKGGESGFGDDTLELIEEIYTTLGKDDDITGAVYWTSWECSQYGDMDEAYGLISSAFKLLIHYREKKDIK